MSDTSDKLGIPGRPVQEGFDLTLTKSAHRNPDIHVRGDSLPESLLEYQEGTGSLNPDIAGLQPKMLRNRQSVVQPGGSYSVVSSSPTAIPGQNLSIFCPPQAIDALVRIKWRFQIIIGTPAGTPANFCNISTLRDGNGWMDTTCQTPRISGESSRHYWYFDEEFAISPGDTVNVSLTADLQNTASPMTTYSIQTASTYSYFNAYLYY